MILGSLFNQLKKRLYSDQRQPVYRMLNIEFLDSLYFTNCSMESEFIKIGIWNIFMDEQVMENLLLLMLEDRHFFRP